jgi:predicted O-methyltransferase YrrM
MAYLLKDLKEKYTNDPIIQSQLKNEFGNYNKLEEEFNLFWEKHIEEVINESSMGNGHIAGAGAVDYNESKVLYFYIRTLKPKNVLEIGHASGCSTVVLARAMEMNNQKGHVYTCDIKGNAVEKPEKNFINSFGKYMDKGLVKSTSYVDANDYVKQLNEEIEFIFIDASHEPEFCYPIAKLLQQKYPKVIVAYHEWAMSPIASKEELSYVSIKENLQYQKMAEREAFNKEYNLKDYEHFGFYGSCGLGIVKPRTEELNIKVYYRLSNLEAGISKKKIANATKKHCLENCISEFGLSNITILGDTLNDKTRDYVNSLKLRLIEVNNGTGSGTFRDALNLAIDENKDSDLIYLLEDDFLHKPNSSNLLKEGLLSFNGYITLYDHPDKYINKEQGGNPFIEQNGEVTRLVKTNSVHWKITNSTVMSFAARVRRLKDDIELLDKYSSERITDSFRFFTELSQTKGIPVLSSIPGYSTHCESAWLSPLTNWNKI